MAYKITTAFLLLSSLLLQDVMSDYKFVNDNACESEIIIVNGGEVQISGFIDYKVKCEAGFVASLIGRANDFVYTCKNGTMATKLPNQCVAKRSAYRRLFFQVCYVKMSQSDRMCEDTFNLTELDTIYRGRHGENNGLLKINFTSCVRPKTIGGFTIISTEVSKVEQHNIAVDSAGDIYFRTVLTIYDRLVNIMEQKGYITGNGSKWVQLRYNTNNSTKGFDCDSHLELRQENDEFVCVGCGKGFWLDKQTRRCHPCGPGFYGDEETAMNCKPCPIQYASGLWSATNLNDCFMRSIKLKTFPRLLEAFILPAAYIIITISIVFTLHKLSLVNTKQFPTRYQNTVQRMVTFRSRRLSVTPATTAISNE